MNTNNTSRSGGVGFSGLLTLMFVGLKLGGVIAWPWLWVLSPIWITLGVVLVVLLVLGALAFLFR